MKNYPKAFFAVVLLHAMVATNAQTLGTYPNVTVIAGQNTTITPNATPSNTTSVVAFTNTNFTGILSVNPATGVVTATAAKPAGTFTVTVKALGAFPTTQTFTLTVTDPLCSKGLFLKKTNVTVGGSQSSMVIGDFNGDGKQDFATANYSNDNVSIRLGDGNGGFNGSNNISVGSYPQSVAIGDFNGDGKQDFATANSSSENVSIRLGDGSGGFNGSYNVSVGNSPNSVAIGDLNGDGKLDFATANRLSANVSIRLGDGNGGFNGSNNIDVGIYPNSIVIGDFNRDGKQDFATANSGSDNVSIRFGDGNGGFSGSNNVAVGSYPQSIAIGDFNGDGKQDFATANGGSKVCIRLGDGNGGFSVANDVIVGDNPTSVAIGDFNGDGKQDFVTANFSASNTVSIRLGNGIGGFSGNNNVSVSSWPSSIAIGDFNGDGKQDFAISNDYLNSASIYLGGALEAEINVEGNSVTIENGDLIPNAADHTDFGIVNLGFTSTRTFSIQNKGTVALNISQISSSNPLYVLGNAPSSIASGSSATFKVTFSPNTQVIQNGTITIYNDDCDEGEYNFAVTGIGKLVVPTLGNYPNATVTAGQNKTIAPGVAPINTISVVAYTNTSFSGILSVNPTTGVVTATDAKPAGTYTITVKAFFGSGAITKKFILSVTNPDPICSKGFFTNKSNVTVGTKPLSVAIGDFNGDGKQDLAIPNYTNHNVSIRLGDGSGGFSGSTNIAVGTYPYSVAIGDFNGDGNQDFASASWYNDNVSIRLGDGSGGFSGSNNIAVGISPVSVAIGDFNGDGKQDFATANIDGNNVSIRLGDGSGSFSGSTNIAIGTKPTLIAISDFNGDGKQDFATANLGSDNVSIRLGDGIGGFSGSLNIAVGISPSSIVIGDFNWDGKQDFATANYQSNDVSICLGNGNGAFTGCIKISVGNGPNSVAVGDFNGDGKQDFAVANYTSNTVSIHLGDGSGGFIFSNSVAVESSPSSVAIGDFNGDGKQDFAATNYNSNNVSISMGGAEAIKLQGNFIDIVKGDTIPLAANHTDFGNVIQGSNLIRNFTIQNKGTIPFFIKNISSSNPMFSLSNVPTSIAAGSVATFMVTFSATSLGVQNSTITIYVKDDGCGEGLYDFSVMGIGIIMPTLGTYPNASLITGQNATINPSEAPTHATSVVAYANSNFSGILLVNPTTGVVTVTDAKPAGTYTITVKAFGSETTSKTFTLVVTNPLCSQGIFTYRATVAVGHYSFSVAIGDFNGDGKQDFAAANTLDDNVSIRLGDGAGGFSGSGLVSVGGSPYAVAIGDFDGDGKQDFVTANERSNDVSIRLGDGNGGFSGWNYVDVGTNPKSVAIGDFNGDGKQDLATANEGSNDVSILLGDGSGGFSGGTSFAVGTKPNSIAIGDFDGDGKQDFATTNRESGTVSIRLGDGIGGFSGSNNVFVGNLPESVAIGDFNGDYKQDLAIATSTVCILLGDGNGGFSSSKNVEIGSSPSSVAIGDFNGDGKLDFAAAHTSGDYQVWHVSVRLGDGSGGFSGTTNIPFNSSPYSIAIGDFNGDGLLDFAAANNGKIYGDLGRYNVTVYLGLAGVLAEINIQGNDVTIPDGDATPTADDFTDFGIVSQGTNLIRNFTIQNRGTVPLSVRKISSSNPMFSLGNFPSTIAALSSATFAVTFLPTTQGVQNGTITIYNDDCDELEYDFAVRGVGTLIPTTYPNATVIAGQNKTITPYVAPIDIETMVAYASGNFSGILTAKSTTGVVTVTDAKPAGVYTITVKAFGSGTTTTQTFSLTVTDPLCSQGMFTNKINVGVGLRPASVAIGDFNGDGKQDFATANYWYSNVSILLGDGNGGISGSNSVDVGSSPVSIAIGDFNGDGKQDFATANTYPYVLNDTIRYSNTIFIRLGDGRGRFSVSNNVVVGRYPTSVAIGDFNSDGKQDIAAANYLDNNVSIRLGDGKSGFTGTNNIAVGTNPNSVVIGDFNGDDKHDLAVANWGSNNVSIRLGDGIGGFYGSTNVPVGINPQSVAIGDFNSDGKQDIAVVNSNSDRVSIRLGDGNGGFSGTTNVAVGEYPRSVVLGDFNGDGKQDFATANEGSDNISIRLGDGNGGFSSSTNVVVGDGPYSIAVGDFNGDGIQDFSAANYEDNNVSFLMGINGGSNNWLGLTADWNTPSNWSAGMVPTVCSRVVVNAGVPYMPTVSGLNNACFSLKLNNGATVTIAKDSKLIITGK